MTYQISKTGHHVEGVPMYRVRDGRNGPSYGPIDGRKSWPRAKAAAIAQLANETRDSPRAAARSRSRLTLAQAAERFIANRQAEGAYKMEHYRLPWLRRHVIGRVQLRNLTVSCVRRWETWLSNQGQEPESIRRLLSLASLVVSDAIERGFGIKSNPFRKHLQSRRKPRGTHLYAVQCEVTKLIKIGRSNSPKKRLVDHQIGSPTPLVLLAVAKHCGHLEGWIHSDLKPHRHHGEWFKPSSEVRSAVADLGNRRARGAIGT